jgi:hypothetical protein
MAARSTVKSIGIFGALAIFIGTAAMMLYRNMGQHIVLALGTVLILFAVSGELSGALLAGSLLAMVASYYTSGRGEGFEDAPSEDEKEEKAKSRKEKFPAPDHRERSEDVLANFGKEYKMPNEKDDSEFHLDAGTTFMNAYKSLKPDQIAAMTKDTQELMDTQKQLMSTLQTLKPLITDGKQMMEMFQSYFGTGNPTPI